MKFKLWLATLLLVFITAAAAVDYPRPQGWINDYAGKLDAQTVRQLTQLGTDLRSQTGFELAVAIVPDMQGEDRDSYAVNLYKSWGVGGKKDEGLLILVAVKERQIKLETGYGAEGYIPDGVAGEIRDAMVPALKSDNYNQAVITGALMVTQAVQQEHGPLKGHSSGKRVHKKASYFGVIVFILAMILTRGRILPWLIIGSMMGRRGFGGFDGRSGGGGLGGFGGFGGFGGGSSGGGGAGGSF